MCHTAIKPNQCIVQNLFYKFLVRLLGRFQIRELGELSDELSAFADELSASVSAALLSQLHMPAFNFHPVRMEPVSAAKGLVKDPVVEEFQKRNMY